MGIPRPRRGHCGSYSRWRHVGLKRPVLSGTPRHYSEDEKGQRGKKEMAEGLAQVLCHVIKLPQVGLCLGSVSDAVTRFAIFPTTNSITLCSMYIVLDYHHSVFLFVFTGTTGILFPLYPNPSSHGQTALLRSSNAVMASSFCSVSAMSSRPFNKQWRRKGSTVKRIAGFPFSRLTSCFSRSISSSTPASASMARSLHSAWESGTGSIPFCMALFRKISPKLGAITQRIPKSFL